MNVVCNVPVQGADGVKEVEVEAEGADAAPSPKQAGTAGAQKGPRKRIMRQR